MKKDDSLKKTDAERLVDSIMNGNNVKAHKRLEALLKKKTAKRIKDTLTV